MPYEDVPQRLRDMEFVPRSEIIGFIGASEDVRVTLALEIMAMAGLMQKDVIDGQRVYALTDFGAEVRMTFIVYLEGDCPECP